ncbi:MAG: hypothetical protein LW832_04260, partial [Parachlamydia sp.]|nr:hypothetical protein [Parachlamydia sp.]
IFHRHLLRPSSLLDLANLSKFAAISAMYWDIKSRRQKFKNLPARGITALQHFQFPPYDLNHSIQWRFAIFLKLLNQDL